MLYLKHALLCWIILTSLYFAQVFAKLVNVTVDDAGVDIHTGATISYIGSWNFGPTCVGCTAHPSADKMHNRTWHDTTYNPNNTNESIPRNASFVFTGSALYVYGALGYTYADPSGGADMLFFVDDQLVGNFKAQPNGSQVYNYQVLLYANHTLKHERHIFTLQNGYEGGQASLALFDYLMYSYEDGSAETNTVVETTVYSSPFAASRPATSTIIVPAEATYGSCPSTEQLCSLSILPPMTISTASLPTSLTISTALLPTSLTISTASLPTSLIISANPSRTQIPAAGSRNNEVASHKHTILIACLSTLVPIIIIALATLLLCRRRRIRVYQPRDSQFVRLASTASLYCSSDSTATTRSNRSTTSDVQSIAIPECVADATSHAVMVDSDIILSERQSTPTSTYSHALSYFEPGERPGILDREAIPFKTDLSYGESIYDDSVRSSFDMTRWITPAHANLPRP